MKRCTMNCGPSSKNPKPQAEMMKDCADCIDDDYVVKGLREAVITLCAMLETSQKTLTSLLDKLPPDVAEQPAEQETRIKLREALSEVLGDAMDCTRVWSAWGVGTMTQDDFYSIAADEDRLEEFVNAALSVLHPSPQPMDEAQERAEFEAYANRVGMNICTIDNQPQKYAFNQRAWLTWKAAKGMK